MPRETPIKYRRFSMRLDFVEFTSTKRKHVVHRGKRIYLVWIMEGYPDERLHERYGLWRMPTKAPWKLHELNALR